MSMMPLVEAFPLTGRGGFFNTCAMASWWRHVSIGKQAGHRKRKLTLNELQSLVSFIIHLYLYFCIFIRFIGIFSAINRFYLDVNSLWKSAHTSRLYYSIVSKTVVPDEGHIEDTPPDAWISQLVGRSENLLNCGEHTNYITYGRRSLVRPVVVTWSFHCSKVQMFQQCWRGHGEQSYVSGCRQAWVFNVCEQRTLFLETEIYSQWSTSTRKKHIWGCNQLLLFIERSQLRK